MALAAALAFGLGGQGVAQRLVEQGYEKSGEARKQIQQQQQQNGQQEASSGSSFTRADSGDRPDARRLDR